MAVITGAGAEYGDPREKNKFIIHSDSQTKPLSDVFASICRNIYGILLLQTNTELYINPTFFSFQPQLVSPRRGYSGPDSSEAVT